MREQHCIRSILGKPPFDQLPEERIFRLQSLPFLDGNRLCSADMLMTRSLPGRSIQFRALRIIGIMPAEAFRSGGSAVVPTDAGHGVARGDSAMKGL